MVQGRLMGRSDPSATVPRSVNLDIHHLISMFQEHVSWPRDMTHLPLNRTRV